MSQPCRHFLAGRCSFGASCQFSHGGAEQAVAPGGADAGGSFFAGAGANGARSDEVCRHFAQGRCTYGAACTFRHDGMAAVASVAQVKGSPHFGKGYMPMPVQFMAPQFQMNRPPCRHFELGKCTYGDACTFSHGVQDAAGGEPCRHFQMGRCTYESNCRFSHAAPGGYGAHGGKGVRGFPQQFVMMAPAPHPFMQPDSTVCRHFSMGRCTFGESCKYSHDQSPADAAHFAMPAPVFGKDGKQPCRHFAWSL